MQFSFKCFECGFGSSCHFVLGLAFMWSLPKYFVVGSLLWLDWEMVSRGPFELDTFVYLEFMNLSLFLKEFVYVFYNCIPL